MAVNLDTPIDVNAIGESPEELRQKLQAHLKRLKQK